MSNLTIKQQAIVQFLNDKPGYKKKSATNLPCSGSLKDKKMVLKLVRMSSISTIPTTKVVKSLESNKGITPKNLLSVKDLKIKNRIFNQMSSADKRIAIAYDVLASIKVGTIVPHHMLYFSVDSDNSKNPQEFLCNKMTVCECCGIGAVFASKVKLGNHFNGDFSDVYSEEIHKNLKNIFSENQLALIEECFEGFGEGREFKKRYNSPDEILIAIMKNIIKNKGTFKP